MKHTAVLTFGDGSLHPIACVEPVSECVRAERGLPSGQVRIRTRDGFGVICEPAWLDAKCPGWRALLRGRGRGVEGGS